MIRVQHWDAFTRQPGKGNPAGIVLATQGLNDREMQAIAKAIGFNDTAFVMPSQKADFRIRYFAPRREVELCGHATIAAFSALYRQNLLPRGEQGRYLLETESGLLPIGVETAAADLPLIVMTQGASQFAKFHGAHDALARAIGIAVTDLHAALPVVYGSTGRWTLVVPVKDLQTMQRMRPDPDKFAAALIDMPGASIHPFCLETIDARARMHARHLSSPASGTLEDAVTGTASGVLGAYYRHFIADHCAEPLVIEQGYEVEREGTVQVWAAKQSADGASSQLSANYDVRIAGHACFVRDIAIEKP